jgi:predicted Zn finger-like uncharacterized protein
MIIKCEQCQTRFRLDDSKVTDKGVKVRCAKCKHVFSVQKEQPEPEKQDTSTSPEQTGASGLFQENVKPPETELKESAAAFAFGDVATGGAVGSTDREEPFSFDTPQSDSVAVDAAHDEFSFSASPENKGFAVESPSSTSHGDINFDEFDFGDSEAAAEVTLADMPDSADFAGKATIQTPSVPPLPDVENASQGLDFSGDDMFGAVVPSAVEEQNEPISFDFGTDSFADSMDLGGADSGQKDSSRPVDSAGEAPFSLGEIDFGDELTSVAVQQVNPDELKTSQNILFAPLAEAQEKPGDDDKFAAADFSDSQEELPPLSISSRRKHSSLFTWLIASVSLLVVGVLGYLGFSSFSPEKVTAVKETGKISVQAVKASYVENAAVGTLLVISGEALNGYPAPRAALQVKASVVDAAGQVLASKTAYGGNPLTNEQLASMPLDKIEASMSNQFGDSLTNLEVPAGKTVHFTIVIPNPPKEGKDFTVEPAGSTVSTGKQQ